VAAKDLIVDFSEFDLNRVIATQGDIRRYNLQRYEMEQLTAIVFEDPASGRCAGYKDVTDQEFWVRGHMPGYPLMPGVMMCEAAAQLCSYYSAVRKLVKGDFMGFGGLENVRFRAAVHVGDRLLLIGKGLKIHPRQATFNVQGFVRDSMVFHADVIGVPLMRTEES